MPSKNQSANGRGQSTVRGRHKVKSARHRGWKRRMKRMRNDRVAMETAHFTSDGRYVEHTQDYDKAKANKKGKAP